MLNVIGKKQHPCEGCRERKKKCSGAFPCQRCQHLRIQCVIVDTVSPPDHDYTRLLQQQTLYDQIKSLQQNIIHLESSLQLLRQHDQQHQPSSSMALKQRSEQKQAATHFVQQWQITLRRHGMTIETNIRTFHDLDQQLLVLLTTGHPTSAASLGSSPAAFPVRHLQRHMPLWLLRRGAFRVELQNVRQVPRRRIERQLQDGPPSPHCTTEAFVMNKLCLPLIRALFDCYLSYQVFLHRPSFFAHFVDPVIRLQAQSGGLMFLDSPVLCSLAAFAMVISCRHTFQLVPANFRLLVAEEFAARARDLVDFDEVSLASLITLTFLALYYSRVYDAQSTTRYLDMVFRLRTLWEEASEVLDPGLQELYKRLHWAMFNAAIRLQYFANQRGVPLTRSPTMATGQANHRPHPVLGLLRQDRPRFVRLALPDEPDHLHMILEMHSVMQPMMAILHSYIGQVRFESNDQIDLTLLSDTESRFQTFYRKVPAHLHLDLDPLLDRVPSEKTPLALGIALKKRLDALMMSAGRAQLDFLPKLFLAMAYLQGRVSLYEPFLQDLEEESLARRLGLLDPQGLPMMPKGTDVPSPPPSFAAKEQHMPSPDSSAAASPRQPPSGSLLAQQQCTKAAVLLTYLMEYAQVLGFHCQLDLAVLLTVWDVHMRNACLDGRPHLSEHTIHQARHGLSQCFAILRQGHFFGCAQDTLQSYFAHVERLLAATLDAQAPTFAPRYPA
ncbi:hypothetical protein DM01DRAFT_1411204 [Hesseltinella vesiculosa]|uniref:Zn(2)-C6 fungal-type domain-containing protein n=1 Tax=Hesseltinella vesiculosa TaxID=101127 RepID=A0A1X2G4G0_9FUNG|nr:hypothetical protein DM01DRAFT_1411204 [Hesseltinella vesiculosa]